MAHYAKVVDGVVTQVIVAEADFFNTFVDDSPGEWVQTSYNTRLGVHYDPTTGDPSADQSKALRKNYAGVDFYMTGQASIRLNLTLVGRLTALHTAGTHL